MNKVTLAVIPAVFGMVAMGSVAFAADQGSQGGPVALSDQQMDGVVAGQVRQEGLVNVGLHLEERAVNIPIDIEVRNVQVGVAAFGSRVIQRVPSP